MRCKNEDELLALNWLREQGYSDIQKPCSDPPDFVVDGSLAVEVTRISQRIALDSGSQTKAEEEIRIPLTDALREIFEKLGPPGNKGRSWVVDCEYDFSSPVPKKRHVSRQIHEALKPLLGSYNAQTISTMRDQYLDCGKHSGKTPPDTLHLSLDCGICLELNEFSCQPEKFIVQDVSDGEAVWVIDELHRSIRKTIKIKSEKIRKQNKVGSYKIWWLILVDHITHDPERSLYGDERSFLLDVDHDLWSRIEIIGHMDSLAEAGNAI